MDDNTEKTNLIVNYLPQQMSDEEFEDLFKKFGSMKSCKIVRNRVSGYSYGFGFVDFENHEQALKAIEELDGHEIEKKKIKVAFARPAGQDIKQANLYIKNIPKDWTQDDVKKVFEPYGNIIQVRVLSNNRGIAFVLFDLRKQAEDALEALNGKTVEGCETPFEIKFAADKKTEKGSGGNKNNSSSPNSSTNNSNNNGSNNSGTGKRERGHRGGRGGQNFNNRQQRQNRGQRNFYDRQNNSNNNNNNNNNGSIYDDRQQNIGQSQYNAIPYGGGNQYNPAVNFNNNINDIGPVKKMQANRMNRYAPFIPIQQPMVPQTPVAAATPLVSNPNPYGFPTQQPIIPYTMMPTQQMASMQPISQTGQLAPQLGIYGAAQMPIGYAPITQNAMNNIYSVASNNLTNAANLQPQFGQPMTMRNNSNSTSSTNDEGVTLFVYNIGPDADEEELRTMFQPYGQVVKCNVVRKTPGGETKGFGFVTLKNRDQANAGISGLNGSMRNGRALQVSLKK